MSDKTVLNKLQYRRDWQTTHNVSPLTDKVHSDIYFRRQSSIHLSHVAKRLHQEESVNKFHCADRIIGFDTAVPIIYEGSYYTMF